MAEKGEKEKVEGMDKVEKAKRIAARKLDFLRHFFIYAAVMAVLAIINNTTWRGYQWWLWPALGWGIGVVAHFLSAYVYQGGALEKRMIQRELERMKDEE
ncbi:MAG: 2TM domain-containing protein [Spirochaetales bacterium]|nr:2TM domain-containing protein [Spirochaetales bacterium]